MATVTVNLSSSCIGSLSNIGAAASTGSYYQTPSVSKGGGTLQIYVPINLLTATGYAASNVKKITFKYEIAQERYGLLSSAGTVSTGYKNSGGSYTEVKNHANGIGKGTSSYKPYSDEITSFYVSGNTVTLGMKITNVINAQTCYYRIRNVSFVIDYTPPSSYTISTGVTPSGSGSCTGAGTYVHGSTATLTATPATGYKFKQWNDGNTSATRTITVTGNATYTATFEKLKYTVIWKNHDGTVLETDNNVPHGTTPTYNGATPTKTDPTGKYVYTFSGWSPTVVSVTGNATYTAQFTETLTTRNITVKAGVGCGYITIDGAEVINSGQTRTFAFWYGSQFTLYSFPQDGYVFSHWLPSGDTRQHLPIVLTDNISVEAVYKLTTHTVIFKDDNGETLQTSVIEHGGTVTPPTDPTKPDTAQHKYTFDGWYDQNGNKWTAGTTITSDITFTARYTATVQKYTVKWYNYDGTLLETDTDVPYGTKPTYNGATPTKPSDDYYSYGFAGWSPSITEGIQGDKNFTAQFAQTDRYYTVRWVNASAEQGVEGDLLETDEVKFNTQPDYNGATPKHPKQDTDPAFNYDFIGWSAKVTDPAKPDTELEKVKGNITYTAIYETTPKLYAVTVILFDGQSTTDIYEYGTEITIEAPEIVDFHQFVKWSDGDTKPSRTVTVTGEATYQAIYERISIPIKVNLEQVTGVYIVPDASIPNTGTIVYVINGTVPTVETKRESVDGWSFLVSNSIPDNGYPLKKLFITESGVTTRVY